MPFDEEDDEILPPLNSGLKQVSSQKSIFENLPKRPTKESLDEKVRQGAERAGLYQQKGLECSKNFLKLLKDKTLPVNKSIISKQLEKEVLSDMMQLAIDINNDPFEKEGMGSLGWIALLLKVSLYQRDKINTLEYTILELEKKAKSSSPDDKK